MLFYIFETSGLGIFMDKVLGLEILIGLGIILTGLESRLLLPGLGIIF